MNQFFHRAVFGAYERFTEPTARQLYQELRPLEKIDAAGVRKRQDEKLRELLTHAHARVPYHRSVTLDPNGSGFDMLARFPVLTKDRLRAHSEELLVEGIDRATLTPNCSGGSTGNPVHLFQDQSYWDHAYAFQTLAESWWGIERGMRTALLWGADRDFNTLTWRDRLPAQVSQVRQCNVFKANEETLRDFATMLVDWRPRLISGYSSALRLFAEYCAAHQILIRPMAIKSTAEVLRPEERKLIQSVFEAPVYDYYGSREVNNLAVECSAHMGMHANELTRVIEIVDEQGNAVPPGVPGRVLVTDLTNFAMPMIRYENEDVAEWSDEPCVCGRPFRLIAKLLGRKSDWISTPEGKLIHGEFFTHMFYDLPEVASFRVEQERVDALNVLIVLKDKTQNGRIVELLQQRCRAAMGANVAVAINEVTNIDRTQTGKHRFTVSTVPIAWGSARVRSGHE
jgi:phenylacetate-CoA ligase